MITAYFESGTHAEEAEKFHTEEEYNKNIPRLEKEAAAAGMFLTESVK